MFNKKVIQGLCLLVLVLSSFGCAIRMTKGTLYVFGASQYVDVSNNTPYFGDVERNGELYSTINPGSSVEIYWGLMAPNLVIRFKAYELVNGQKRYVGMDERTFYPNSYVGHRDTWVVDYVRVVRRSF